MDLMVDALFDGRKLCMLTVVDLFTRECLAIDAGQSLKGEDVSRTFTATSQERWLPRTIKSDNGSEFISKVARHCRQLPAMPISEKPGSSNQAETPCRGRSIQGDGATCGTPPIEIRDARTGGPQSAGRETDGAGHQHDPDKKAQRHRCFGARGHEFGEHCINRHPAEHRADGKHARSHCDASSSPKITQALEAALVNERAMYSPSDSLNDKEFKSTGAGTVAQKMASNCGTIDSNFA